jgi:pyridoxal phosphate enzyme (YggS family)
VTDLSRLEQNLRRVRERIATACNRRGRDPAAVTLVVVTKSIPADLIPQLMDMGVTDIGENRAVEGLSRVGAVSGLRRHMIGHLQTNKVGKALRWADTVHSVDRPSLVRALSEHDRKVPVFLQVNVSGEASKGGFDPGEVEAAVRTARRNLEVVGLMTMAPLGADARPLFRSLRELASRAGVEKLSMGMTQDFEIALEEGATHVRVGTAIFEGVLL